MNNKETIFALASGAGKSGIAVIRISGAKALECAKLITGNNDFTPNTVKYFKFKNPQNSEVIDSGLVIYFQSPHSFTGEDVVELHCHGSRAVISEITTVLSSFESTRIAEPGEFSRRAVVNGKFDLTSAEGLIDLINADTQAQRIYALRQKGGELKNLYQSWQEDLKKILAWVEAYIDFPEEDVPQDIMSGTLDKIKNKISTISEHINNDKGKKLRDGFKIAIVGAPNAGKSTLINAITKKDAAIVSSIPGTTRDIIEVYMDIEGYPVIIADTAGLRETSEEIESEGIKRAKKIALNSDLILFLVAGDEDINFDNLTTEFSEKEYIIVINKSDISQQKYKDAINISAKTGQGIDILIERIKSIVTESMNIGESPALTRIRHKECLEESVSNLTRSIENSENMDMMAEDIRLALRSIGQITGQVLVDEILDIVFKDFCIGK